MACIHACVHNGVCVFFLFLTVFILCQHKTGSGTWNLPTRKQPMPPSKWRERTFSGARFVSIMPLTNVANPLAAAVVAVEAALAVAVVAEGAVAAEVAVVSEAATAVAAVEAAASTRNQEALPVSQGKRSPLTRRTNERSNGPFW